MQCIGSGRCIKVGMVIVLGTVLTGMSGCALGPYVRPQQVSQTRHVSSAPAPQSSSTMAASTPLKVEKPLSTAIEEFLARTQAYAARGKGSTETISTALPVAKVGHADEHAGHEKTREQPVFRSTVLTPTTRYEGDTMLARDTMSSSVVGRRPVAIPAIQRVFVRSASQLKVMPTVEVVNEVSNQPMHAGGGEVLTQDRILSYFRDQVQDDTTLANVWSLKFVELALAQPTDDPSLLSSLGLDVQETLGALLHAVEQVHASLLNPVMPTDDAVEALDALHAKIVGQADPVVSNTVFCQSVTNFGIYEEMPLNAFVTGQRVQTIVYSEIDHLSSGRDADGMFRTVLGTHLEVLTEDGKTVWQDEQPEIVDRCRRQRRDFFVAQRVTLPATLPAGDYILKVFVEDKLSGRATEVAHKFEMLSPTHVAGLQGTTG